MKNSILTQILAQDARARRKYSAKIRRFRKEGPAQFLTLTDISCSEQHCTGKSRKAQAVENMLIQMAKSGPLPGKVCSLCAITVCIIWI